MKAERVIAALAIVQIVCAFIFVSDILASTIGLRAGPIRWQTREMIEIGAAIGLILGAVFGARAFVKALTRQRQAEESLRLASGAFMDVLHERFEDWALTPSERDVALFAIKGMSTAEIAALRSTSEGTVKAQTNAIYRKAGVSGRPQLLSLFIDELLDDGIVETPGT